MSDGKDFALLNKHKFNSLLFVFEKKNLLVNYAHFECFYFV